MIKRIAAAILISAFITLIGCTRGGRPAAPTEAPTATPSEALTAIPTEAPTAIPTEAPTAIPTEAPTAGPYGLPEGTSDFIVTKVGAAALIMDSAVDFVLRSPLGVESSSHPYVPADKRAELSEKAKAAYDRMLAAADAFEALTVEGGDEVGDALAALFIDRPDIEIYFTMERDGGEWHSVFFEPETRYFAPAEDMERVKEQVEAFRAVVRYVVGRIPEDISAIDKYRLLACYISERTTYAHVLGELPRYAVTAYGALVQGRSICQGYAIGFEYLCREANLACRRVTNGYTDDNMHFWDIVDLDCGTYFVDVTWCDGYVGYKDPDWLKWFMFVYQDDYYHVPDDGTVTTGAELGLY